MLVSRFFDGLAGSAFLRYDLISYSPKKAFLKAELIRDDAQQCSRRNRWRSVPQSPALSTNGFVARKTHKARAKADVMQHSIQRLRLLAVSALYLHSQRFMLTMV